MGTSTTRRRATQSAQTWYDSPWRIAAHALSTAGVVAIVAVVIAIVGVPRLTGGTSLTVLTGSMEPTFSPGDVIVVRGIDTNEVCATVTINTIITFLPVQNDSALISHRVIGKTIGDFPDGTNCRLITQGDANSSVDAPVSPQQVRGVFLYGIPKLGWARQWVGDNVQLLVTIGAIALITWGIWSSLRRPRTRVYSMPVTGEGTPIRTDTATPLDLDSPPAIAEATAEQNLRERDLALRERELQLRERELEFARRQTALTAGPGPTEQAPPAEPDSPGIGESSVISAVPPSPPDSPFALDRSET